MVNKIRFILVILMGIMCLTGCSADKESLDPCPFSFTDWTGGIPNLEAEMLKQTNKTIGKAKEKIDEWTRDPTKLENCIKIRCNKDAECVAKELARAESAWLWSIADFFAIQHWELIILIMLTILIFRWPMPYPERWYHNTVLLAFLTYFALLLFAVFWWLPPIILLLVFIKQRREYAVKTQYFESELCPLCGGNRCDSYCEQSLDLPDHKNPDAKRSKKELAPERKNPADKYL